MQKASHTINQPDALDEADVSVESDRGSAETRSQSPCPTTPENQVGFLQLTDHNTCSVSDYGKVAIEPESMAKGAEEENEGFYP